jgi:hypothetical protein
VETTDVSEVRTAAIISAMNHYSLTESVFGIDVNKDKV